MYERGNRMSEVTLYYTKLDRTRLRVRLEIVMPVQVTSPHFQAMSMYWPHQLGEPGHFSTPKVDEFVPQTHHVNLRTVSLPPPPRASRNRHACSERDFFIDDNLLVRIHFIIVMIRWTGLAPWEFEVVMPVQVTSLSHACSAYSSGFRGARNLLGSLGGVAPSHLCFTNPSTYSLYW